MADEKQVVRRPRGTVVDRGIALLRSMDDEDLALFAGVVRGFAAAKLGNGKPEQSGLELGGRAAEED